MSGPRQPTPPTPSGLAGERTALAWERTAFTLMVAGVVLARFSALHRLWPLAVAGLAVVALGAGLLVWAGVHHEGRSAMARPAHELADPAAARFVGMVALATCALCILAALLTLVAG